MTDVEDDSEVFTGAIVMAKELDGWPAMTTGSVTIIKKRPGQRIDLSQEIIDKTLDIRHKSSIFTSNSINKVGSYR